MSERITVKNLENLLPYFAKIMGIRLAAHYRDNGGLLLSNNGLGNYSLAIVNGNSAHEFSISGKASDLYAKMHFAIDLEQLKHKQQSMKYRLIEMSASDMLEAQNKALENNTVGLSETTQLNDPELWHDKQLPTNAKRACFETYTGDYAPIFIQFYQGDTWYKVEYL